MNMEYMCKKSFVSVDYDIDTSKMEQGRLYDWNDPQIIKKSKQFAKGKLYSILEFLKLDAKYRVDEFWYSDTEMLKKLRKQKFERIKKRNNNLQ
jgi:hypothetical protein